MYTAMLPTTLNHHKRGFSKTVSGCYCRQGGINIIQMCHMLKYVHIAYLVQYAEYLMGYEAKYSLTMRFISFAMIRLATAIS